MEKDTNATLFLKCQKLTGEMYDNMMSQAAAKYNLTKPEADVLIFLYNNPEFDTAKDIVTYRGLSKAYVSKAVDLLMRKGIIDTVVCKNDRRYVHLKVSEGAQGTINELRSTQRAFIKSIMSNLSDEEIEGFWNVVEKMIHNVQNCNKGMK